MLLALIVLAGLMRFWQLGDAPPGLYRDEAHNGLDALAVLDGETPLFFRNNNGREPAYIYLTALSISLFGRSALAVRLAAAVVGTLTTIVLFGLGRSWFNQRVGLLSAFLWATTLWPVHLSRIGLRPILLAPLLGLTFWLGTEAYRRKSNTLWLLAGLICGLSFYTYLASRVTPLLLLAILVLLIWQKGQARLWPGALWFAGGAIIMSLPLVVVLLSDPALADRAGQVSILNETINGGDFWGTLWRHIGRGLGLFFWRGDTILRHNPAGRPLFDLLMTIPWLIGLIFLLRRWREPVAYTILLWHLVMLSPTILAEDAPHFLRAAGLLPVAMLLPALGLSQIWSWTKLPVWKSQSSRWCLETVSLGPIIVILMALVSWLTTIRDYQAYSDAPETAYLFEAAAREMAAAIDADSQSGPVFVEERYRQGWASIPFLVSSETVEYFEPGEALSVPAGTAAIYLWPFQSRDFLADTWSNQQVEPVLGPETRGDLETETYPLYVTYQLSKPEVYQLEATFANQFDLLNSAISLISDRELEITLWWSANQQFAVTLPNWTTFVHVGEAGQPLIGQSDRVPAMGFLPLSWWHPGLVVVDRHRIQLAESYQTEFDEVRIGFFDPETLARAAVTDATGQPAGDSWRLRTR